MHGSAVKVLEVVTQLNRGGIECRLMDIVRSMDYARVQLDIYTCRMEPGILDVEAREYGSVVYYNKPINVRNMFSYSGYFADFLKRHSEYQIVHVHQNAWCSVFCKGAKMAGVPVRIAHSHTSLLKFSLENMAKNIIKLPTRRYATHFFAVSDVAGEWLFGRRNMKSGKVEVWPNAIDCEKYKFSEEGRQRKRKELAIENNLVVAYIGNIRNGKNPEKIWSVFCETLRQREDSVLLVAGRIPDEKMTKSIGRLQIEEKVRFLGSRSDINEILWASDVLLLPSLYEGIPGCVIEAQAAGLPCVISDTITRQVCITPLVAQLSPDASDGEWARKILEIGGGERRDLSNQVMDAGFDIKSLTRKLEEFYENSLRGEG